MKEPFHFGSIWIEGKRGRVDFWLTLPYSPHIPINPNRPIRIEGREGEHMGIEIEKYRNKSNRRIGQ